jgi:hypothetical protein
MKRRKFDPDEATTVQSLESIQRHAGKLEDKRRRAVDRTVSNSMAPWLLRAECEDDFNERQIGILCTKSFT